MADTDATEVRFVAERSRYELVLDERVVGVLDVRDDGAVAELPHTEIDRGHGGRGFGTRLVQAALDDLRAQGRTVVPSCWFVADFIAANPSYADLLAAR